MLNFPFLSFMNRKLKKSKKLVVGFVWHRGPSAFCFGLNKGEVLRLLALGPCRLGWRLRRPRKRTDGRQASSLQQRGPGALVGREPDKRPPLRLAPLGRSQRGARTSPKAKQRGPAACFFGKVKGAQALPLASPL